MNYLSIDGKDSETVFFIVLFLIRTFSHRIVYVNGINEMNYKTVMTINIFLI